MEVRCRTSIAGMPKVEGYLEKRGKFNLKCLWRKYWFVLDGRSLLYFKSKDSYESLGVCKGMIDFSRVQVIRIPARLKYGFPFEVVTRSKVIYLSANDSMTRDIWIEELRHAIRPPQISDPFNTSKISAPHLSNLFEQVCSDPAGSKVKKSITENKSASIVESTEYLEEENTVSEDAEKEIIMPFNENKVPESNQTFVKTSVSTNFQNSTDTSVSNKNLEQLNPNITEEILLKLPSKNTSNKHQTIEESDETDDGNDGSNYETAEETLENENYFDKQNARQSYGLPYPLQPEYDLSVYCELKGIISSLESKDVNPSINKLGKSVAVEAMRNFLCETETVNKETCSV